MIGRVHVCFNIKMFSFQCRKSLLLAKMFSYFIFIMKIYIPEKMVLILKQPLISIFILSMFVFSQRLPCIPRIIRSILWGRKHPELNCSHSDLIKNCSTHFLPSIGPFQYKDTWEFWKKKNALYQDHTVVWSCYRAFFSPKFSQKILHSMLMRVKYGMYFCDLKFLSKFCLCYCSALYNTVVLEHVNSSSFDKLVAKLQMITWSAILSIKIGWFFHWNLFLGVW